MVTIEKSSLTFVCEPDKCAYLAMLEWVRSISKRTSVSWDAVKDPCREHNQQGGCGGLYLATVSFMRDEEQVYL